MEIQSSSHRNLLIKCFISMGKNKPAAIAAANQMVRNQEIQEAGPKAQISRVIPTMQDLPPTVKIIEK